MNKDGQLFVETFSNKILNKRYIYSLLNNGREFYKNSINEITLKNTLNIKNIKNVNSALIKGKQSKAHSFLNILYGDNNKYYFEFLKISSDSDNIYYTPKNELKKLNILSNSNSLFGLSNKLLFFSYFNREEDSYYLKLIKGSINLFNSNTFNISYNYTQFTK